MLGYMKFPGGKGRLYQKLISLMPPHRVYIEAFAGGASVLRHKRPAPKSIALDRDLSKLALWETHRPPGTDLLCADALTFLSTYSFQGDELVYCDPPYLPSVRRRRRVYKFELSERQHADLLEILRSLPCRVMISGYESELYHSSLVGWSCESFRVRTHASWAEEFVWFNFEKPAILHDGRFIGADFRERHTIRRRLDRIRKRIAPLSASEKGELHAWLSKEIDHGSGDPCAG